MTTVAGIVLAAGASERMGEPKLLLPFRGSTVLNATIAAVESSAVDRVVIVTGARADEVEASLRLQDTSPPSSSPRGKEEEREPGRSTPLSLVVRNPDYRRGNMSSLLTAVDAVPDAEAFVLVPGDLPTIRTDLLDLMIDLWLRENPWAAVTEYTNRIAHPFLLSRAAVSFTEEMMGKKVLGRILIDSNDDRVARLSTPHAAPRDVNTPQDYEALLRSTSGAQ